MGVPWALTATKPPGWRAEAGPITFIRQKTSSNPAAIDAAVLGLVNEADAPMSTLAKRILDPRDIEDANTVKVVEAVKADLQRRTLAALARALDSSKPTRVVLVLAHTAFSDPQSLTQSMIAARMRRVSDQPFHLLAVEVYEQQGSKQ